MKKRIIKKWISRYIKPLLNDLPQTKQWDHNKHRIVSLVNGEQIGEGMMYEIDYVPQSAIKKQIAGIRQILNENKVVSVFSPPEALIYLNRIWHMEPQYDRKHPKMKFTGAGIRFVVEK